MSELRVERSGDVEVWTLDRPHRRNALSRALLDEIDLARKNAKSSVVVLAGAEKGVFCAGFDLDDLRRLAAGGASTEASASRLHDVLERIERAPFTLVSAIDGPAIGAGVELALLGDVRIASTRATFTLPPAKIGVVYPRRGLARLHAALGASLLGAMLATAEAVSAERLATAGVLYALNDEPAKKALRVATRIASLSPDARFANRDLLRAISRSSDRGGNDAEGG